MMMKMMKGDSVKEMKKKPSVEVEIQIGGRAPGSSPVADELNELEMEDEDTYATMAPKGVFTSRALDPLVKNTNKLLVLFGQDPSYPKIMDTDKLPTDFTRVLAMFVAAVDDAIEAGVLDPEMKIDLSGVRSDAELMSLSGKIEMLARDREFKRFLQEEQPEEMEMEDEAPEAEMMTEEDADAMMMERL
tara:strand:+ start:876 stop:1442 length:567 start_codon:yes stop_codon:yes gene_type:complete